jgi:hypothetical protein
MERPCPHRAAGRCLWGLQAAITKYLKLGHLRIEIYCLRSGGWEVQDHLQRWSLFDESSHGKHPNPSHLPKGPTSHSLGIRVSLQQMNFEGTQYSDCSSWPLQAPTRLGVIFMSLDGCRNWASRKLSANPRSQSQ